MHITNEKIVEQSIEIVSEALKGGLVALFTTYAHLLRKNIQLENELNGMRLTAKYSSLFDSSEKGSKHHNNSSFARVANEHASNSVLQNEVQQNIGFNSFRKNSEKNILVDQPKNFPICIKNTKDKDSYRPISARQKCKEKLLNGDSCTYKDPYAAHPLSGCLCNICKSLCLNNQIRRMYKLKANSKELRKILNRDNIWATYCGKTICEIVYIGHRPKLERINQNLNKKRVVGAVIRLSNDDAKELFVSLQDLYSVKSCNATSVSVRMTSGLDSGFEASCTNGIVSGQPTSTKIRIDSEAPKNKNIFIKNQITNEQIGYDFSHLNANFLSPFDKGFSINCNRKGDACKLSCPSMSSCQCRQIRYSDQPEPTCKLPMSRRKASLQDSPANYANHLQGFDGRRRASDSFDSAISLSSHTGLTDHSFSNLELCQCSNRFPPYGSVVNNNRLFSGTDEFHCPHQKNRFTNRGNCLNCNNASCYCNQRERPFCCSCHH